MNLGREYGLRPAPNSHWLACVCVLLCTLTCLPACAKVAFQSQDVAIRLDEATDTLTLELTYHGLMAAKRQSIKWAGGQLETSKTEPDLESGEKLLLEIARGEPVFMVLTPLLEIRLDQSVDETEKAVGSTNSRDTFEARAARYLSKVQVHEARVYVDNNQRLTAYQRLSFPDISAGLALWSESLRHEFLAKYDSGKIKSSAFGLDEATIALVLADIQSEHDWISCKDGGFHLSLPASGELIANLLTQSLGELGKPGTAGDSNMTAGFAFLAELFSPLSSLSMQDGHVQLSFALGRPEGLQLHIPFTEFSPESSGELDAYDPALLDFMRRDELKLPLTFSRQE